MEGSGASIRSIIATECFTDNCGKPQYTCLLLKIKSAKARPGRHRSTTIRNYSCNCGEPRGFGLKSSRFHRMKELLAGEDCLGDAEAIRLENHREKSG
jgi:hypothetical protein